MRSEADLTRTIEIYSDMLRKICFMHLKNYSDVEDVFQDVFLKYMQSDISFESEEHKKAWLIRVTVNRCKDVLKNFFRRNAVSIDSASTEPVFLNERDLDVFDAVAKLPTKFKNVVYLFYYEEYTVPEIARILHKKENTIYTWLGRARNKLKENLGGDFFEE
ncbi:RNA polymerase sigma factor [Anaerostipes sp.]|uniref:RNA polymerase sigma factor n=1 Tax=Anaerostipes sp. TaxID=1872530 RepID=UPI0025BE28FF|nr:sigma-70 family RNA polymerase sigma factor [Anaerostipes sp.]MBS7008402.1 sigma-70 family RNA polymerase sigma factor [Anaerostipes sp.]